MLSDGHIGSYKKIYDKFIRSIADLLVDTTLFCGMIDPVEGGDSYAAIRCQRHPKYRPNLSV